MFRLLVTTLALAGVVIAGVFVMQHRPPAPMTGEGWTGLTEPEEIIEARRVLMIQIEQLMRPIDEFAASGTGDLPELRSAAATIEAMMLAFPHLFPPTTNLFDATVREPPTYTLPRLWDEFGAFQALVVRAEEAAGAMMASDDPELVRAAARALRASCDACHALFTRPYTPPRVTPEDLEFDFDSLFPAR
jgi:cytochrome c556